MKNSFLKNIHKKIFAVSLMSMFLFSFVLPAHACGCGVLIDHNSPTDWSYGKDSAEKSFINYQNGIEKLIISLDISPASKDAFFIVPVPGDALKVRADILSDTPSMSLDFNVAEKTKENLNNVKVGLLATQIYPMMFLIPSGTGAPVGLGGERGGVGSMPGGTNATQVIVYQHLEKNGMTAEVLSAKTPDALYEYFAAKGLNIQKNSIPIFQDYINKDFTFVASWITGSASDVTARGISMDFPTKEIYYPLKPGSAYAGDGTEKEIFVMGQVTPKLFGELKNTAQVDYYYHLGEQGLPAFEKSAIKSPNSDFFAPYTDADTYGFTRVKFTAKPQALTEDLYFKNSAPVKVLAEDFIAFHSFIIFLMLLLPLTLLALWLSSKIWRIKMTKHQFRKLWILSWFTIIGAAIGSRFMPAKKFKFIAVFSIIFIILSSVAVLTLNGIF